jgi:RNA polymerase sigma factor (sigma-70 family)
LSQTDRTDPSLEELVRRAQDGNAPALERVIRGVGSDVYGLAVRMLWHPEDAEDATQEILMKIVTHLSTFRGESAFRTWVYRIATNHLLGVRQSRVEREQLTFTAFGDQLASGLADALAAPDSDADMALLEEEVKIGCTQAMLLCLDREQRVAYVLGDVFELKSEDAAYVLAVEAATFRKRLSRARERLRAFMRVHCGLVNEGAACRCARRVETAIRTGRVDPGRLLFAGHPQRPARVLPVLEQVSEMEELHSIAGIFQSHPDYTAPERVITGVRRLLDSGTFSLLS